MNGPNCVLLGLRKAGDAAHWRVLQPTPNPESGGGWNALSFRAKRDRSKIEGAGLLYHRIGRAPGTPDPDSAFLQCVVPTGQPDTPNTPYRGIVYARRMEVRVLREPLVASIQSE
jgi:hypothetical protein